MSVENTGLKEAPTKVNEDDKLLLQVIDNPLHFILFTHDEILTGPENMHKWEQRLISELDKIHVSYKQFLQNGMVVCADKEREDELEGNLNRLLNIVIRKTIKSSPRAMVRNRYGFDALKLLRERYSGSAARYCFDMIKQGLAPSSPDESYLQRAERFQRTYRKIQGAGLTLSQFYAIMAILSCNNDKLLHIAKNKKDMELEAENLLRLTQEIGKVYPEVFVDEDRENVFEAHENRIRAKHSQRYRPRDATHRCTRCGFIGHRSTFCKIDWDAIQKYRNTRNKGNKVYTKTSINM